MNLISPAEAIGHLLAEELQKNPHFYFFSPDETTSNRFHQVFDVSARTWDLPTAPWDLPESSNGRIVELLSENILFSMMTGHLMNGEPAMMGSYEAFFGIITSQLLQQIKFFTQSKTVSWRPAYPAVNLLSTSTCWRQDHNGFTHQSPALISTLLAHPAGLVNCFFPADAYAAESAFRLMLNSKNVVNLTTFNKIPEPTFLSSTTATEQLKTGASIFDAVSDDDPDFILVTAGDIATKEAINAIKLLKADLPKIKLRLVNIAVLSYRAIGSHHHKLDQTAFARLFTSDKPLIVNFHGYPEAIESILRNYDSARVISTHGFIEQGSTTTPFEMLRKNHASRYDLALDIAKRLGSYELVKKYQSALSENHAYAVKHGIDLPQLAKD